MSAYDLILQGGTLYDPCAGTMELCDLAIKDGKIAARGKNLNAADAETVMDVTGLIVSPGLIDMHCHVYPVFPYQMPDSLRTIQAYIGSLDRVDYFVKALGLVNSAGDFYNMPAVMNGYSDLMVEIFGHRGQHARAAMGAYVLPGNMPVSVDAIVKIRR